MKKVSDSATVEVILPQTAIEAIHQYAAAQSPRLTFDEAVGKFIEIGKGIEKLVAENPGMVLEVRQPK